MKLKLLNSAWICAAVLAMQPAGAHHSFAMFDFNNTMTFDQRLLWDAAEKSND